MPLAAPADVHATAAADRAELAIVRIVNRARARRGRAPLGLSGPLLTIARNHSIDMLRHDAFGHLASDGSSPATRIRRATGARTSGETVAFASRGSGSGARTIVGMWRRSPGHWTVLMDPRFRSIGIGRVRGRLGSFPGVAVTADLAAGG